MGFRSAFDAFVGLFAVPKFQFELPDESHSGAAFSESGPISIDALFRDIYNSIGRIDRRKALTVPAVKRGRDLICSISTLPLLQYDANRNVVAHPLLRRIDPDVTNLVTLSQTLEDLLFEGISWWWILERDFSGFPTSARHLDVTSVTVNPPSSTRQPAPLPSGIDPRFGVVWVDGKPVSGQDVIRFDSPNTGLLYDGHRAIKTALALDEMANVYANNPRMFDYFTPSVEVGRVDPGDDKAVQKMLDTFAGFRQRRVTGYIPAALEYHTVDVPNATEMQLVERQRQATLAIANALGLDPEDLGISTTSRTYQNAVDRRKDRVNDVLSPYMRAVSETLSGDNVTRRGYEVAFDLDDYLRADPKARAEIDQIYHAMGARTITEIRRGNNWAPLTLEQQVELIDSRETSPDAAEGRRPGARDSVEASSARFDSDDETTGLTFETTYAAGVDESKRTITGLVVPFGEHGISGGKRWRFGPGSIQFTELSRIKLLRDHDWGQLLGRAVSWQETAQGITATFKVAPGPDGDKALALAKDKVLDGLSVRVDPITEAIPDPQNRGVWLVKRSTAREVSLTARPSFDSSRVTAVVASNTDNSGDTKMPDEPEQKAPVTPARPEHTDTPDQAALFTSFRDWMAQQGTPTTPVEPETPAVVNPVRLTHAQHVQVHEELPYQFDRGGNFLPGEHTFSADLLTMQRSGDFEGQHTEAGKRVMGLIAAQFTVETADVSTVNPTIQRPDLYVDQREFRTPLWDFVNRGAPPNGVQPFAFPKFNTATGLVSDHTQGTEPTSGNFTTTSQTVTPTPLSGKASVTREVWDMGGNPAVSTLIWNQMRRSYREGLESATATFLNTLTAATDINLGIQPTDAALIASWESALTDLQFVRGYDWTAFALEKELYKKFAQTKYSSGEPAYPMIAPQNRNGTAASRFTTLDLGGVTGVPSWALPSTPAAVNNSWLFDPSVVWGFATAPQRLEFAGTNATGGYAPVAFVDIAVWGYKAFANSDIAGVRQVLFDSTTP